MTTFFPKSQSGLATLQGQLFRRVKLYRLGVILLLVMLALVLGAGPARSSTVPTLSIVSVEVDKSVTIRTHDFPANQDFVVTMGKMGTLGVGGQVVTTINSGKGGSFEVTYAIPAALKGQQQVAIRLQTNHLYPYSAYNWFWNNTTTAGTGGIPTTPTYTGMPTFAVTAVAADKSVTIETNNFPANQTFAATMGKMGTKGVKGLSVGSLNSQTGGKLTATFTIPDQLKGLPQIAIRLQTSHASPYFAYNWFWNNTAPASQTGTGGQPATGSQGSTSPPAAPAYAGIPTFKACGVAQNASVTVVTSNFPPNQSFTVTMGAFGTQGIGGYSIGTITSGDGSSQRLSLAIPSQLQGLNRIAIRMQTAHANPYYAYNWFWNSTATVC